MLCPAVLGMWIKIHLCFLEIILFNVQIYIDKIVLGEHTRLFKLLSIRYTWLVKRKFTSLLNSYGMVSISLSNIREYINSGYKEK